MLKSRIWDNANVQKIKNQKKLFLFLLFFIGIILGIIYYFYILNSSPFDLEFNLFHYNEYFTRSIILYDSIKNLDLVNFYAYFLTENISHKLIYLRPIPFYFLFSPTQFTFFYSNFIFNYLVLIALYLVLLKIFEPIKSFLLTLSILTSYLVMELFASFYIDLTVCLACAIFFIYLKLFLKDTRKNNIEIILLVTLLFSLKNFAYLFLPIIWVSMSIYLSIKKKSPKNDILRMTILFLTGFLLYFILFLGGNQIEVWEDITISMNHITTDDAKPLEIFRVLFKSLFTKNSFNNIYFLNAFPFFLLNIIVFLYVPYTLIVRKDVFYIILLISSIAFNFIVFNILKHGHMHRLMFPFYFIYFLAIFELFELIFKTLTSKPYLMMSFLILGIILFNVVNLADKSKLFLQRFEPGVYDHARGGRISSLTNELNSKPIHSRIYLDDIDIDLFFKSWLVDNSGNDFFYLEKYDKRFRYVLVQTPEEANYILSGRTII